MSHLLKNSEIRCIQEAEGYLELVTVLADRWPLDIEIRDRVVWRALSILDKLDSLGPWRGHVLYLQGQAYRTMERYEDAIEPLSLAAREIPTNLHVWLALGWCYKRIGRLDLAIDALNAALVADTTHPIVYYNLACYWSLADNATLAMDFLSQALDLDPNYRDLIADEADFAPIRNTPEFQAMIVVIV